MRICTSQRTNSHNGFDSAEQLDMLATSAPMGLGGRFALSTKCAKFSQVLQILTSASRRFKTQLNQELQKQGKKLTFERITAKKLTAEEASQLVLIELNHILKCQGITQVWLFGSAARNELTDASDLDFILTFPDTKTLKWGRKKYFSRRRRKVFPTDVLFILHSEFERLGALGGVCFVCKSEGKLLFQNIKAERPVESEA